MGQAAKREDDPFAANQLEVLERAARKEELEILALKALIEEREQEVRLML